MESKISDKFSDSVRAAPPLNRMTSGDKKLLDKNNSQDVEETKIGNISLGNVGILNVVIGDNAKNSLIMSDKLRGVDINLDTPKDIDSSLVLLPNEIKVEELNCYVYNGVYYTTLNKKISAHMKHILEVCGVDISHNCSPLRIIQLLGDESLLDSVNCKSAATLYGNGSGSYFLNLENALDDSGNSIKVQVV